MERRDMCRHITLILTAIFMLLTFGRPAIAQGQVPIKCAGCHKNLSQVLPNSHRNYKLQNLSLCFSCHKQDGEGKPLGEKIHVAHLRKKPETMKNCLSCHVADKAGEVSFPSYPSMKAEKNSMQAKFTLFDSWMQSAYLDHGHMKKGIYCLGCHTNYMDELEATETKERCVKCHGNYDDLMKLTGKSGYENNPHKSHYPDLRCDVCHHGHKEFTDYCAKCHNFGYQSPEKNQK
jgi:hypothetical protein